jgi:flagellar hook-basal body complex protein FliE
MEGIKALAPTASTALGGAAARVAAPGGFGEALKAALDQVNAAQNDASRNAERFQMGDPNVTLEETMISMQKASISFQAVVQARNRLMSAYHDVMNMSV